MIQKTNINSSAGSLPDLLSQPDPKYLYQIEPSKPCPSESSQYYQKDFGLLSQKSIEQIFFQKQEVIDSRIQMLYFEIGQRVSMKNQNLYRINLDQCACRNLIEQMCGPFYDQKRLELERKIVDLEAEKRREENQFFKDILFLNKELRMTKIEAIEERQKKVLCQGEEAYS